MNEQEMSRHVSELANQILRFSEAYTTVRNIKGKDQFNLIANTLNVCQALLFHNVMPKEYNQSVVDAAVSDMVIAMRLRFKEVYANQVLKKDMQ